jgi:hypothetical protein
VVALKLLIGLRVKVQVGNHVGGFSEDTTSGRPSGCRLGISPVGASISWAGVSKLSTKVLSFGWDCERKCEWVVAVGVHQ